MSPTSFKRARLSKLEQPRAEFNTPHFRHPFLVPHQEVQFSLASYFELSGLRWAFLNLVSSSIPRLLRAVCIGRDILSFMHHCWCVLWFGNAWFKTSFCWAGTAFTESSSALSCPLLPLYLPAPASLAAGRGSWQHQTHTQYNSLFWILTL